MADIELVDVSLRDGNQCLWSATGLNTAQTLEIAPVLDRIGFRALDYTSSTHMGISVRVHRENPWEMIGLTRALMPRTHLQFIGTGFRFISWEVAHPEFMQLAYDRLVERGISRFVVLDPMHDMQALLRSAQMVRKSGATEVIAALTYTVSPVHDDAFYSGLASRLAGAADVDRVYIKDPAGILTLERARTLIPAIVTALRGKPLEFHSHCTIGLAPLTCLTAAELGVRAVQVAIGPLSNGSSLPNAERVVANLRELGHRVDIDDCLLAVASEYFRALAEAEGLPVGTPQEFDAAFLRHQVAGGVMTTTRRHLQEIGLEDRFDAVVEESIRVRRELGQPIMVTPFSADRLHAGTLQRDRSGTLRQRLRPGHSLCPRALRPAHRPGRSGRARSHPDETARARARQRAPALAAVGAASPLRRRRLGRGVAAARGDARRAGRRNDRRGSRAASL
jgi:oxaloacetate decarboxylase alpha subunit